ncbi:MAG: hypothetical protein RIR66_167 [Actinomycetota bacterium]
MQLNCFTALLAWPVRRWVVAVLVTAATYFIIGLPTVVINNDVFGRDIAVTSWAMPVLVATSILSGLLFATYVKVENVVLTDREAKLGGFGGFFSFLAIGCPVCNKLALIALGYSGAIEYFAPVQPYLAAAGVGLLFYALRQRLNNENSCRI